jgi:hypothetical protein
MEIWGTAKDFYPFLNRFSLPVIRIVTLTTIYKIASIPTGK